MIPICWPPYCNSRRIVTLNYAELEHIDCFEESLRGESPSQPKGARIPTDLNAKLKSYRYENLIGVRSRCDGSLQHMASNYVKLDCISCFEKNHCAEIGSRGEKALFVGIILTPDNGAVERRLSLCDASSQQHSPAFDVEPR